MSNRKLKSEDYIWVRVVPDDFYEDGVDAIWKRIDDNIEKPVKINDRVAYYKKGRLVKEYGKVVAFGPAVFTYDVDEDSVYYADLVK